MATRALRQVSPRINLTQAELTRLVRERFSGLAADLMCRMISVLPDTNPLWNVRSAKAQFAELLAQVRKGHPQFLLREGDEEPVMLLSLGAMHELVERGIVGQSFTEGMGPFMHRTHTRLRVRESAERDRFTIPAVRQAKRARS
jgi:hypothetical protein